MNAACKGNLAEEALPDPATSAVHDQSLPYVDGVNHATVNVVQLL